MRQLFLVGLLCALVACGSPTAHPEPLVAPAIVPMPAAIHIPDIDAQSNLVLTGLDDNGALEVPPVDQPLQASWWDGSPRPGEPGPAVILGHVDGTCPDGRKGCPGIFKRLGELDEGYLIDISRVDNTSATFIVYKVAEYDKDSFPTREVYGNTEGPELRLVTCSGPFDRRAGHYENNTVVFARLAP